MYEKVECIGCGRQNIATVRKCICGTMQHNKNNRPAFFHENSRCYVFDCKGKADERRSCEEDSGKDIWTCKKHGDDFIVKNKTISEISSAVIVLASQIEADAKAAGLSNLEYFKQTNPKAFAAVQKSMKEVHKARDNTFAVEDYLSGG
jgi:hypothetical protein